jgi:hypothetical protein
MIDLSKKNSNKKNHNKKFNIKDAFSDIKNVSDPLEMSNSLSSSLSDIEKITNQAKNFKSRFVKFFCFILFILLIYIIYKLYVSFIKKKPLVKYDFDIEKDIQELLDNFK